MKSIVSEMNDVKDSEYELEDDALYYDKPVLSRDTCMNRCNKRQFKLYTHAAKILDYLHGLITFITPSDMFMGIKIFEKYMTKEAPKVGSIIKIVNVTVNKFDDDKGYFNGISFNVLVYDRKTFRSIIGRIDFVLDWMIEAEEV